MILLTGAGFSRNWGGWLANEAFEYILGRPEIGKELRRRLWQDKIQRRGFEDTLGELQRQKQKGDQSAAEMVREFMGALVAMFDEMNRGLSRATFEWQNETSMMVRPFLACFDYVFTLNQDLLLERHYLNHGPSGKFDRLQMPGLKPVAPGRDAKWTPDHTKLKIEPRQQPYIKLHGLAPTRRGQRRSLAGQARSLAGVRAPGWPNPATEQARKPLHGAVCRSAPPISLSK